MARGGFRPNSGRPGARAKASTKAQVVTTARAAGVTPLEYMLAVVNDPKADAMRRDRLAIAAAPFCHPRIAESRAGKKDVEAAAAKSAGADTEWSGDLSFDERPN